MVPDQYLGWLAPALTPAWARARPENSAARWAAPKPFSTPRSPNWNPTACRQPMSAAAKELAQTQATGIRLLTWDEPEYPQRLREIYDPSPLLYVRGNIELLNRHLISIAGSRRPTPYGNQMAEKLARDLADRGLVLVSGLARGMVSCAHKGALSSLTDATIDVLGCEIDVIYPKENKKIFAEMEKRGVIISEFAMGTFPGPQELPDSEPGHFGSVRGCGGRRRRAMLWLVDHGSPGHGTWARSLWRPRQCHPATSFGPNQLIKQGAELETS